jgi:hypothetical protein
MPNGAVAGALDLAPRKLLVRRLQFLQTDAIRLCLVKLPQQHLEATIDAVDVVGGELHRRLPSLLAIALVTLARLCIMLGVMARVGGQRARDIDALLELSFLVTADIALVGTGIDQFAFTHGRTLSWLLSKKTRVHAKRCMRIRALQQTRKTSELSSLSP